MGGEKSESAGDAPGALIQAPESHEERSNRGGPCPSTPEIDPERSIDVDALEARFKQVTLEWGGRSDHPAMLLLLDTRTTLRQQQIEIQAADAAGKELGQEVADTEDELARLRAAIEKALNQDKAMSWCEADEILRKALEATND